MPAQNRKDYRWDIGCGQAYGTPRRVSVRGEERRLELGGDCSLAIARLDFGDRRVDARSQPNHLDRCRRRSTQTAMVGS